MQMRMNEMMEEYEMTSNSRERGEREARRRRDDIIWDANHKAEDIYAASVLYSNEALGHIQTIIQSATDEMEKMFHTANGRKSILSGTAFSSTV